MKRSRFAEEQIIGILREQESGVRTAEFCRKNAISGATFYNWKARFAEGIVSGNPAADRRTATKTGSSAGTGAAECVITTGGVCLIDEGQGQIGRPNVVRDAEHDGNAESTAQPVYGFQGTPPSANVYTVPKFIWGMTDKISRYRECAGTRASAAQIEALLHPRVRRQAAGFLLDRARCSSRLV